MRLARVFLDVDMRMGFQGIRSMLVKEKTNLESLGKGSMIIFMNRASTKFKLLAGNDFIVYYNNGHRKIPLDAIQFLPTWFDGSKLSIDQAVLKSLKTKLNLE